MGSVLAALALTPSAPVLVPDLAGAAAAEVADAREAAIAAAAALPDRWLVVGVGPADRVIGPDTRASYAGYGADVEVALSSHAPAARADVPLCALWAGWLRGQANPAATAEVRVYSAGHSPDAARAAGRALRAEIDAAGQPVGVLVVADGAATLTPAAPGGFDPDAPAVQAALDDALAAGDPAALAALGDGITGRVAYQVLAGLVGSTPCAAREMFRGAPYGVGYFVGLWTPEASTGLGKPEASTGLGTPEASTGLWTPEA